MRPDNRTAALDTAVAHARTYLASLDDRPVGAAATAAAVRDALGTHLPEHGEAPGDVIDALAAGVEPGLVASAGPRHFGFVVGGALPAALAADWLVSAWDRCAAFHALSPAGAAVEEITAAWILDLLALPAQSSVGFVTGGQGANTTCLAAARHAVLARAGWDVERDGLIGALAGVPPLIADERCLCWSVVIFEGGRCITHGRVCAGQRLNEHLQCQPLVLFHQLKRHAVQLDIVWTSQMRIGQQE